MRIHSPMCGTAIAALAGVTMSTWSIGFVYNNFRLPVLTVEGCALVLLL